MNMRQTHFLVLIWEHISICYRKPTKICRYFKHRQIHPLPVGQLIITLLKTNNDDMVINLMYIHMPILVSIVDIQFT